MEFLEEALRRKEAMVRRGIGEGSMVVKNLRVVEAVRTQGIVARGSKLWGLPLGFRRLWENQGLPEILHRLARGSRFGFEPERVSFAMALQRLCCPGSDLQGSGWIKTVEAAGFETIELQHLYRTTGFLAEVREELSNGSSADHKAFEAMIQKMRERFRIRRVIVVADRGMISQGALCRGGAQAESQRGLGQATSLHHLSQ